MSSWKGQKSMSLHVSGILLDFARYVGLESSMDAPLCHQLTSAREGSTNHACIALYDDEDTLDVP